MAKIGPDAVMMYDLHAGLDIRGCGRGRCQDLKVAAWAGGSRFRVTRFWEIESCPHCGRSYGFARADQTLYLGDSHQEALEAFAEAEGMLLGYSGAA
jgi:hypothetical protein